MKVHNAYGFAQQDLQDIATGALDADEMTTLDCVIHARVAKAGYSRAGYDRMHSAHVADVDAMHFAHLCQEGGIKPAWREDIVALAANGGPGYMWI